MNKYGILARVAGVFLGTIIGLVALIIVVPKSNNQVRNTVAQAAENPKEPFSASLKDTVTEGNRTYIELSRFDMIHPEDWCSSSIKVRLQNARTLLRLIMAFEEKHPELEVTDWKVQRSFVGSSEDLNSFYFPDMVWLTHRPRTPKK